MQDETLTDLAVMRAMGLLLELGWEPAGVSMHSANPAIWHSPSGPRPRLRLPGTDRRVTVGPRVVTFYRWLEGHPAFDLMSRQTADLAAIRCLASRERPADELSTCSASSEIGSTA